MRWGEIKDRLDSEYYIALKKITYDYVFPLVKVGTLFHIRDGDHSKFPQKHSSNSQNGIRYLRAQDLQEGQIISDNPVYVSREYYETIPRSHIKPGYILFSIMGTVGSVAVFPEAMKEATANRAVGILVPRQNDGVNPYYLVALFSTNLGAKLFEVLKKGGVQQRINLYDMGQLQIPLPPIAQQNAIVTYLQQAYTEKRRKETEAQRLLDSIDNAILDTIGITLPPPTTNTLKQRIFYTQFNKILNNRLTPSYYMPNRLNFFELLETSPNIIKLKDIMWTGSYGILPPGDCYSDKNPVTFIRATELKNGLRIDSENTLRVPQEYYDNHERSRLQINDILLAVKGATIASNKCVAFVETEIPNAIVNGSIFRFQVDDRAIPKYVAYMLASGLTKSQMKYNLIANNAVDYLDKSLIENLLIHLPPIEAQIELVHRLDTIWAKSSHLIEEANLQLEMAEKQVEQMILGAAA